VSCNDGKRILAVACALLVLCGCAGHDDDAWRDYDRGDGTPLLTIPRDEWPKMATWAMEQNLRWGQCRTCGKIVTWKDVGDGAMYETASGSIIGFYCEGCYSPPPQSAEKGGA
jgi:hypothetical protein